MVSFPGARGDHRFADCGECLLRRDRVRLRQNPRIAAQVDAGEGQERLAPRSGPPRISKHLDRYLSATQLGITLTSLGLGWVGEPYVAHWISGPLAGLGIVSPTAVTSIAYALAFAAITFVEIVFGELVRNISPSGGRSRLRYGSRFPSPVFYYVAYPFIWLLNRTANRMLMWMGIPPTKEFDHGFNQEELQYVLMNSRHVHPSDDLVNKIMLKAIRLKDTTAEQVMLPRDQVVVLWRDLPLAENLLSHKNRVTAACPFAATRRIRCWA